MPFWLALAPVRSFYGGRISVAVVSLDVTLAILYKTKEYITLKLHYVLPEHALEIIIFYAF